MTRSAKRLLTVPLASLIAGALILPAYADAGFLGVEVFEKNRVLCPALKEYYGVEGGALIENVVPGSPAQQAGLLCEDVIVRFQGKEINSWDDFKVSLAATKPNTKALVTFVRDHREITVSVLLGLPEAAAVSEENRAVDQPVKTTDTVPSEQEKPERKHRSWLSRIGRGLQRALTYTATAAAAAQDRSADQNGDQLDGTAAEYQSSRDTYDAAQERERERAHETEMLKLQQTHERAMLERQYAIERDRSLWNNYYEHPRYNCQAPTYQLRCPSSISPESRGYSGTWNRYASPHNSSPLTLPQIWDSTKTIGGALLDAGADVIGALLGR